MVSPEEQSPLPRLHSSSITHHRAYVVSTRTRTARVQFRTTSRGISWWLSAGILVERIKPCSDGVDIVPWSWGQWPARQGAVKVHPLMRCNVLNECKHISN